MTYDWKRTISAAPFGLEWFQAMDERWISASYPYLSNVSPFDRILPADLTGSRVLEIGCGMGLHTAALVERGANVTAIDLTEPAVEATRSRLALMNCRAQVLQVDGESLPFDDQEFDFVWSWGVIHHSAHTGRIVRGIARVLKPDGEARVMVYNRDGLMANWIFLRHYLLGLGYRKQSLDEVLWEHTDGFLARYYSRDQLGDLFDTFFQRVRVQVLGQEVDVVPLPSKARRMFINRLDNGRKLGAAGRRGGFLFVTASHPLPEG